MNCERKIYYYDDINGESYLSSCNNKAKYKVTYIDSQGNKAIENICGLHLNSLKKWADRIKKRAGYDVQLIIKEIKNTCQTT